MIEIERKFLVDVSRILPPVKIYDIRQGYLNTEPDRTVRVRIQNNHAYLTVKGKSSEDGLSRFEWEEQINYNSAVELMKLCTNVIHKERCIIPHGNHIWEVDVFHGDNEGLVIAEIELSSVDEQFERPPFITVEVTGDERYYNSALSINPYSKWSEGLK